MFLGARALPEDSNALRRPGTSRDPSLRGEVVGLGVGRRGAPVTPGLTVHSNVPPEAPERIQISGYRKTLKT